MLIYLSVIGFFIILLIANKVTLKKKNITILLSIILILWVIYPLIGFLPSHISHLKKHNRSVKITNANSAGEKNIEIPKNCPKCNTLLKKVPILYGEPTRETMEMATKKEIVLGGCLVYEEQPNYAFVCPQCGDIIGKYLIEEDDISYMSNKEIEDYFKECIKSNKIFFYTGGYTNLPLVDEKDIDFVSKFKTVSVGCTGGVLEATKFNELMLNYVRSNNISPPK